MWLLRLGDEQYAVVVSRAGLALGLGKWFEGILETLLVLCKMFLSLPQRVRS